MLFYTYVWSDPEGTPFYVGKGRGYRARDIARRSEEFMEIYCRGGCSVEIVDEFILESQAHAHEMELIALYGRREFGGLLVNKTDGGEGSSGYVATDETREKISVKLRKLFEDPAQRERRAIANLKRYEDPEERERSSAAQRFAYANDPGRGGRHAATLRQHYSDQSKREKLSEGLRERYRDRAAREVCATSAHLTAPGVRNTSGYKGVTRATGSDNWVAQVKVGGKYTHLGTYATKEMAALAYDNVARKAWPDGCYLNFPDRIGEDASASQLTGPGPQAGLRKNNNSGFKGVSFVSTKGKWSSVIFIGGKSRHIGYFESAEDAALAYDSVAHATWGDNCYLNLPDRLGQVDPPKINDSPWRGPRRGTAHGFKGTTFYKRTGRWRAQITENGKTRGLGYFDTAEEAATAYDDAARAAWGQDCYLNFPERFAASA